jgi:GTP-binding protein
LKILSAELVASAAQPSQFPQKNLPEVAFIGRSNVGKSSLINSLLLQRRLAYTSSTPGRTQQINFFLINQSFFFVDLPGYGYAKIPKVLRESWKKLIEGYLKGRKQLAITVLIVDSRIGPTQQDLQKLHWLQQNSLPFFIVSTKADKLSKVELQKSLNHTQSFSTDIPVVAYSAVERLGRDQVWSQLHPYVKMITSHF